MKIFESIGGSKPLSPAQISFLERYILNGQSIESYLGKSKKLSKGDKRNFKAYEDYTSLKDKFVDYMDGVIASDPGRDAVLQGLDEAIRIAGSGDFAAALTELKKHEAAAKALHKYVEQREKAKSDLEKRQAKARKEKRKSEEKVFKARRKEAEAEHKEAMAQHAEVLDDHKGKEAATRVLTLIGEMAQERFRIVSGFDKITQEALGSFVDTPKDAIRVPEHSVFVKAYDAEMQKALDLLKPAEVVDDLDGSGPEYQERLGEITDDLADIRKTAKTLAATADGFIASNPAGTSTVVQAIRQALIEQRNETVNAFVDKEAAAAEELIQSLVAWGNTDAGKMQGAFDKIVKIEDTQDRYRALKDLTADLRKVASDQYGDYREDYKKVAERYNKTRDAYREICLEVMLIGGQSDIARPTEDQLQLVDNLLQSRQPNQKNLVLAGKMLDEADKMLRELRKFEEYEQRIHDIRKQVKSSLGVKANRQACPALHQDLNDKFMELDKTWPSKGLSKAEELFNALLALVKTGPDSFTKKAEALIAWRKDKAKQCKQAEKYIKALHKKVAELTNKAATEFRGDALNEFDALKTEIDDESAVRPDVDTRMQALLGKLESWTKVDTGTGVVFDAAGNLTAIGSTGDSTVKMADHLGAQEFMADQKTGIAKLDADRKMKENVEEAISQCADLWKQSDKIVKSKKGKSDLKDAQKQIKQANKLVKSGAYEDALAMIEICKTDIQRATQGIDLRAFQQIPGKWKQQADKLAQAAGTLQSVVNDTAADPDEKKLAGQMKTAIDSAMSRLGPAAFQQAMKTFQAGDHLRAREEVLRQVRFLRDLLDRDPRLSKIDGTTHFGPGISIEAAKSLLSDIERSAIVQT
ncbi:hypothetical protein I5535_13555 [Rhodobacteraceae bacterium F11138]|nr:hypothetical protein [Rhodobacteraceae bacterium F11138]